MPNLDYYEGPLVNGAFRGKCKAQLNGVYYEGDFYNNFLHGEGKKVEKGIVYEGTFYQDKLTRGIKTYPDGTVEKGIFENELLKVKDPEPLLELEADKTITDTSGTVFTGKFKVVDGYVQGYATAKYTNGSVEVGVFENSVLHGEGKRTMSSKIHQGTFKKGIFIKGKETYTNSPDYYEGTYLNQKFQGKGKILYQGTYYEGDIVDGYLTGEGTKRTADGTTYVGTFVRDYLTHGVKTYPDGRVEAGDFRMDKLFSVT